MEIEAILIIALMIIGGSIGFVVCVKFTQGDNAVGGVFIGCIIITFFVIICGLWFNSFSERLTESTNTEIVQPEQ